MPTTISKFLAIGMSIEDAIERTTSKAAKAIHLDQLGSLPAKHQADRVFAISVGMFNEVAEHPVSLSATAGAAEKHLEYRTGDERALRTLLCGPDSFY